MRPIADVAADLGLSEDDLDLYGRHKAKLTSEALAQLGERPLGDLVLVTGMTPTTAGEGKTTTAIGLTQALRQSGANAAAALREPSMGPVFGIKGGGTGGGNSQVVPADDINLHFTGDLHAVTAANNLLAAAIDNLPVPRQCTGSRPASDHLAALHRHERSSAARGRDRDGRYDRRHSARRRLRHHAGIGSDGDPFRRQRPRRSAPPPRRCNRRLHIGNSDPAHNLPGSAGRRCDDCAAQGRDPAQPRADGRGRPRVRPRRTVRQHRTRLQLHCRH